MPKKPRRGKSQPAGFLLKTYNILENCEHREVAAWAEDGLGFLVRDVTRFSSEILPKYFKHNNFASFVRQLNMYDFHKKKTQQCQNMFHHPYFVQGKPELLGLIKRKIPEPELEELAIVRRSPGELPDLRSRLRDLEAITHRIHRQNEAILKENRELQLQWNEVNNQRNNDLMLLLSMMVKSCNISRSKLQHLLREANFSGAEALGEVFTFGKLLSKKQSTIMPQALQVNFQASQVEERREESVDLPADLDKELEEGFGLFSN